MNSSGPENIDLLQNIEFAIVLFDRERTKLLDMDAKDAIDAAVRHYQAEMESRTPPRLSVSETATQVFEEIQSICEWRLGRRPFEDMEENPPPLPIGDIVEALKEVQKSIPRWSKRNGSRGYLDFVSQYVM